MDHLGILHSGLMLRHLNMSGINFDIVQPPLKFGGQSAFLVAQM